jgi:hypothetical protein
MLRKFNNTFFHSVENRSEHSVKLLTAGFYFAFTFIFLNYLGHAWSTANAWNFGYTPLFSYEGIDSLLGTTGWSAKKIGIIYLMPPLLGIIVLILGLFGINRSRTGQQHLKTFLFWLSVNGLLLYASYISTGFVSGLDTNSKYFTGFVGYYAWLYWKNQTIFGVLALQWFLCIPIILYLSRLALKLNYSNSIFSLTNGKRIVWMNVVAAPFLIGSIIVAIATFPMDLGYQLIRLLSFIPIMVIMLLAMQLQSAKEIQIYKGGMRAVPIAYVSVAILILILISRTVLSLRCEPFW